MFKQRKSAKAASRTRTIDVEPNVLDSGTSAAQTAGSGTPMVEDEEKTVVSPAAIKAKMKTARKKPETRLSFNADPEEGEDGSSGVDVFKLKKSMLSRKLMQKAPSTSSSTGTIDSSQSNSPKYDEDYLRELKASTPQSRSSLSTYQDSAVTGVSLDPEAVARMNITAMDDDDATNTVIPAESTIKLAKERRVRAQANKGSEDDFISLSVTRREVTDDGPHPESRLVREEDELGEADDEFAEYTSAQERVAIGKKSRRAEASKTRASMKEMIEDAEEEDEETMEWEQEQLRRGGHRASSVQPTAVKQEYRPAPIPDPTPLPTLTASITRLNLSVSTLTASHATKTASMATLAQEMQGHAKRETELRDMVGRAEDKRAFFMAFREWVESVAAFLDEKFPHLEKLEEEHLSLLKEKADMIAKRRREDDEDDASTFLPSVPRDATQPEEAQEEELDEFGRAVPRPIPSSRRADRVARRSQRQRSTRRPQEEEEGYSTDSSLPPPTATAYKTALSRLSSSAHALLSDVRAPEFRDPAKEGGLATWWGRWRRDWEESYVGAWGGLGLVGAWEFWVREEVCGWDCVEDPRSLDSFRWYQALHAYSRPNDLGARTGFQQDDEDDAPLGPDGDLVGAMISTAVVPRLCAVLESGAFDVYSSAHVRRIVDLVEEVEASLEDNAKLQMLLKSVCNTFALALRNAEALLTPRLKADAPLPFKPDSIPARLRVMARLVKLLKNVLRWRKYNKDRCGLSGVVMGLVELLESVAETGWDVGGRDIMVQVVGVLPGELAPQGLRARLQSS